MLKIHLKNAVVFTAVFSVWRESLIFNFLNYMVPDCIKLLFMFPANGRIFFIKVFAESGADSELPTPSNVISNIKQGYVFMLEKSKIPSLFYSHFASLLLLLFFFFFNWYKLLHLCWTALVFAFKVKVVFYCRNDRSRCFIKPLDQILLCIPKRNPDTNHDAC